MGFKAWFRKSMKESSFKHIGSYMPKGFRVLGPSLELALSLLCLYKIRFAH
jgi:hypothetical protein